MPLITVFFPRPNTNLGYAKAIIDEKAKDFFIEMGAHLDVEVFLKPKPDAPSQKDDEDQPPTPPISMPNPDEGWGPPGSLEFHTQVVRNAKTRTEVIQYVFEVTGRKLAKRGELSDVQRNALKRIKEFMDNGESK